MKPILCYCRECRRHRTTRAALVHTRRKSQRSRARWLLRCGQYEHLQTAFYVGYTDWPLHPQIYPITANATL